MQMEITTKASGKMIKLMGLVNTLIQTGLSMKDFGSTISNMDREKKNGLMVLNMKEIINMEKKMDSANFYGPICHLIKEISMIIIFMDMVNTNGLMVENIQEIGFATKCMEKDFLHGRMGENIKVIIMMIKNKAMVFSLGQMEDNMMVSGIMESKME